MEVITVPNYEYSITKNGNVVVSFAEKYSLEDLEEQLPRLLKLLNLSMQSSRVAADATLNQMRVVEAMKALYEFHLYQAESVLETIPALQSGEITAGQVGFPEFDDDVPEGLFD